MIFQLNKISTYYKGQQVLIEAMQNIYDETGDTPPMRLLIKVLRNILDDSIDSRYQVNSAEIEPA